MAYAEELIDRYKSIKTRLNGITNPVVRTDLCRPIPPDAFRPAVHIIPRSPGQRIVDEILLGHKKHWYEVFGYNKLSKPSLIRNEVWWTLRNHGYTLQEIGKICRVEKPYDHSTVLHGIRRHQKLLDDQHAKQTG